MPDSPATFDQQADSFDARAGLPAAAAKAVAAAVVELAASHAKACGASRARVLELGAGTGEIGVDVRESDTVYAGLDLSLPMLRRFSERIHRAAGDEPRSTACLIQADASTRWPIGDATTHTVFGSRSLHLLSAEHVVAEFRRVAAPSACLVIGRTERDPEGLRAILRRAMHERLRERGFEARRGGRHARSLAQLGVTIGARALDRGTVASWRVTITAQQALDSWRTTGGLGGVTPPPAVKEGILNELEDYAGNRFGGLDVPMESEERYILEGIELAT